MATHSSILAREIPWTEEPGGLQSMGSQESNMTQQLNHHHWAIYGGFPDGLDDKNLPAVQETRVRSLGQKDPLEDEMTTHSSILAWRVPWTGAWHT